MGGLGGLTITVGVGGEAFDVVAGGCAVAASSAIISSFQLISAGVK